MLKFLATVFLFSAFSAFACPQIGSSVYTCVDPDEGDSGEVLFQQSSIDGGQLYRMDFQDEENTVIDFYTDGAERPDPMLGSQAVMKSACSGNQVNRMTYAPGMGESPLMRVTLKKLSPARVRVVMKTFLFDDQTSEFKLICDR